MRYIKYILALCLLTILVMPSSAQSRSLKNTDRYWEIGAGEVSRFTPIFLNGYNADIDTGTDPEDVWNMGGSQTLMTVAAALHYSSSALADTTQTVTIDYLDAQWDAQSITVTCFGRTETDTGIVAIRVNNVVNNSAVALTGDFYVYEDDTTTAGVPDTQAKIHGKIDIGKERTQSSFYSVPRWHTAYIMHGYVANDTHEDSFARMAIARCNFGDLFQFFTEVGTHSSFQLQMATPFEVAAQSDIKMVCTEVGADDTAVSAGYILILEDLR